MSEVMLIWELCAPYQRFSQQNAHCYYGNQPLFERNQVTLILNIAILYIIKFCLERVKTLYIFYVKDFPSSGTDTVLTPDKRSLAVWMTF